MSSAAAPSTPEKPADLGTQVLTTLLDEVSRLSDEQTSAVASATAKLWRSFNAQFGGMTKFMQATCEHRADYIAQLRASATRMHAARLSDKAHFFYATTLMLHYISAFDERRSDDGIMNLARKVACLIDLGRALEASRAHPEPRPHEAGDIGGKRGTTAAKHIRPGAIVDLSSCRSPGRPRRS
jgi:hypothetical protein